MAAWLLGLHLLADMFHYKAAIYDFYTESTAACTLLEHSNIGIDVYQCTQKPAYLLRVPSSVFTI